MTFFGQDADARKQLPRRGPTRLAITWGQNKDHRPDRKPLLFILTVAKDGGVAVDFQAQSGNLVDDPTHHATGDRLCRLTGRRDFLDVADCQRATVENLAHVHQHGGRFLTVLPRSRSQDGVFRQSWSRGRVPWCRIDDQYDDQGNLVDRYSIAEPAMSSAEGYRLVWYHSTRKAQIDAAARRQVERALEDRAEWEPKLSSPRSRYHHRAKVAEAVETILEDRGTMRWISTEINERIQETYR